MAIMSENYVQTSNTITMATSTTTSTSTSTFTSTSTTSDCKTVIKRLNKRYDAIVHKIHKVQLCAGEEKVKALQQQIVHLRGELLNAKKKCWELIAEKDAELYRSRVEMASDHVTLIEQQYPIQHYLANVLLGGKMVKMIQDELTRSRAEYRELRRSTEAEMSQLEREQMSLLREMEQNHFTDEEMSLIQQYIIQCDREIEIECERANRESKDDDDDDENNQEKQPTQNDNEIHFDGTPSFTNTPLFNQSFHFVDSQKQTVIIRPSIKEETDTGNNDDIDGKRKNLDSMLCHKREFDQQQQPSQMMKKQKMLTTTIFECSETDDNEHNGDMQLKQKSKQHNEYFLNFMINGGNNNKNNNDNMEDKLKLNSNIIQNDNNNIVDNQPVGESNGIKGLEIYDKEKWKTNSNNFKFNNNNESTKSVFKLSTPASAIFAKSYPMSKTIDTTATTTTTNTTNTITNSGKRIATSFNFSSGNFMNNENFDDDDDVLNNEFPFTQSSFSMKNGKNNANTNNNNNNNNNIIKEKKINNDNDNKLDNMIGTSPPPLPPTTTTTTTTTGGGGGVDSGDTGFNFAFIDDDEAESSFRFKF